MTPDPNKLRKAAVLAACLDTETADRLLDQLPAEQADLLRRTIASLGAIDPRDEREAIDEFLRMGPLVPRQDPPGLELDDRLARQLRSAALPDFPHTTLGVTSGSIPFRFLHETADGRLTPLLKEEHPQTIALVMSHLPPARTLEVLAGLPPQLQAEVLRRLVNLDDAHPEILREVERGLESRISDQARGQAQRQARLSIVAGILGSADHGTQRAVLANLQRHDPQLAAQLHVPPPVLNDLGQLDDADLALVFSSIDLELAVLALAGAELQLARRVLPGLETSRAKALRHALDHLGPTRLSDMGAAEQEVLHTARRLIAEGRIRLNAAGIDTIEFSTQAD